MRIDGYDTDIELDDLQKAIYQQGREDKLKEVMKVLDASVAMQTKWYQQGREDLINEIARYRFGGRGGLVHWEDILRLKEQIKEQNKCQD